MPHTLILTLLPNGVDRRSGRLRLSVVANFQVEAPISRFDISPLVSWPTLATNGLPMRVIVSGTDEPITVTRLGPDPDQQLWDAIFAPDAPVGPPPGREAAAYESLRAPYVYRELHAAATSLYAEAAGATGPFSRDHPVAMAVAALSELTDGGASAAQRQASGLSSVPTAVYELLDPDRLTRDRLVEAIATLTSAQRPDAARIAPFASIVTRQRRASAGARNPTPPGPAPLDQVPPIQRADVHQVLGMLLGHPSLARRLGLIIDLEAVPSPALGGEPPLRVDVDQNARVRSFFEAIRTPPSRVRFDPDRRLFVMSTRPGAITEIRDGMLDVTPDPVQEKYTVGDLDLESLSRQLQLASAHLADGASELVLPVRRDVGLALAQRDRTDLAAAAVANTALWQEPPEELEGEPVLYADDVTAGYRVDVARNGGRFHSLMRRVVEYFVGERPGREPTFVEHDEGSVEPLVAVQQTDGNGGHTLTLGEEVFGWDGWALGAPLPGPKVATDVPPGGPIAERGGAIAPGYGLAVTVGPEPGTLTPLRYGDTLSLRARAVDLAGNSLAEDDPDSGQRSAPQRFVRHEPAAAAVLVPTRPFGGGETLTRIVVRSDGEGRPLDGPTERHLAPPPVAQRVAERHGMFDAAIGHGKPTDARDRMLAIGRLESGSFTDPVVNLPDGGTAPAEGIAVVAPPGETSATLPLPVGQGLPAGQYVVHTTERLRVPHLPDPAVSGVTFMRLPLQPGGSVAVSYGDAPWPQARPARLVVRAAAAFAMRANATRDRAAIEVDLAPGQELDAAIASTLKPAALAVMDPLPPKAAAQAAAGLSLSTSLRQRVKLVHATRKPVTDPTLTITSTLPRGPGATVAGFTANATFDGATTGKLDLVATWDEVIDPGVGDVRVEPRRATLASVVPPPGTSTMTFKVRHDFGDTKHRHLVLRLVAATKFRDCFPELAEGDPLTLREGPILGFTVTNTTVPAPITVHSVVPTYRWERTLASGRLTSERRCAGVRVYVARPGAITGAGERLGVVVYKSQQSVDSPSGLTAKEFVTRWGDDPLEQRPGIALSSPSPSSSFPRGVAQPQTLQELAPISSVDDPTMLVTHALRFAADRGLWYADVDVLSGTTLPAFLRLGLVRFQSASTPTCHVSRVRTTDWIPLPITQRVSIEALDDDEVFVRVGPVNDNGQFVPSNRKYRAALQPRLRPSPPGAGPRAEPIDITTADGEIAVELTLEGLPQQPQVAASQFPPRFMVGTLRMSTTDPAKRAALLAGRIVVTEEQVGSQLERDAPASRPLWLETVDRAALRTRAAS